MSASSSNLRQSAFALADRVAALAGQKKTAERAAQTEARQQRRRRRAQVSLAPVRLGRDEAIEPVEKQRVLIQDRSGTRVVDRPCTVADPWPDPGVMNPPPVRVTLNRRVDILQQELSNGRITEVMFRTGRIIQQTFEKAMGRVGGGGWGGGDKVDTWTAHELAVIRGLQTADEARAVEAKIVRQIGIVGARMLRAILIDRMSLSAYAEARGKSTEHGKKMVAGQFRMLLEDASEAWAAHGASRAERDADPWAEPPADNPKAIRRSTNRTADTLVRGERAASCGDIVDTDVNGVAVPLGKGFRVTQDHTGDGRWMPDAKRRRLDGEAHGRLRRAGGARR
jgi:hypothetical protein